MGYLPGAASLTIAITAVLTFYTALLHLARRKVNRVRVFRSVRGFLVGMQALQLYFVTRNMHLEHPLLLYPLITLLFITGPLNYIRYTLFLYPGKPISLRVKAQFIPVAVIFAWETWFYFFNPAGSRAAIHSLFSNPAGSTLTYFLAAGVLVVLAQHAMLLQLEIRFAQAKDTREPLLVSSAITILYMLELLLIAGGIILNLPQVMLVGILLNGLTGIAYLFFEQRYPDFYQLVARETREKKYKKSLLQGLSKDVMIERLRELMEVDKIYRQLDLKLEEVAGMLLITSHQLSELINDCLGMSFTSYINRYRVAEAKQILRDNPEKSTISIAFEVGFGTKQRFNTIFKELTGTTPSGYRNNLELK